AMFFGMTKLPCIARPSAGSAGQARYSSPHRTLRLRLARGFRSPAVRSPAIAAIGLPATDPKAAAGRTAVHACGERSTLAQIYLALRRTGPARSRHAA